MMQTVASKERDDDDLEIDKAGICWLISRAPAESSRACQVDFLKFPKQFSCDSSAEQAHELEKKVTSTPDDLTDALQLKRKLRTVKTLFVWTRLEPASSYSGCLHCN